MDQKDIIQMLELYPQPAFCVKDGLIHYANQAAQQHFIEEGKPIAPMLVTGAEEYAAFTQGYLSLHICAAGNEYEAIVCAKKDMHIFSIPQNPEASELQAMALAAQELRQPLSSILTVADQLMPTIMEADAQSKQSLSQMNKGLYQLLRIVTNMSDAYRYSCQSAIHLQTVNLRAVFDEILEKSQALLGHTNLKLSYQGLERDQYALANEDMLSRSVYNLISNAIKFSPAGGEISVKVTANATMVCLQVTDQGEGISTEVQPTVFTRYLRQPGIEDGRFGIGLGMALIRSTAAAHGGTVLMDHPVNGGTRFTLTLALKQASDNLLRSKTVGFDPLGGMDLGLIQLSDALPSEEYSPKL